MEACENVGDSHVREGVVVSVDEYAYRVGLAVAYDIHAGYVAVGGLVVCAVLDVQTYLRVLYRNVAHHSLTSAVDGNTACNSASVYYAADE